MLVRAVERHCSEDSPSSHLNRLASTDFESDVWTPAVFALQAVAAMFSVSEQGGGGVGGWVGAGGGGGGAAVGWPSLTLITYLDNLDSRLHPYGVYIGTHLAG